MTRIAFAVPVELQQTLVAEAERHGHDVVARWSGAALIALELSPAAPTVLVAGAEPRFLDERVVAACDEHGVSIIALVSCDAERRHAATLGLFETADATSDWSTIELMLAGARRSTPAAPASRGTVIAVWGPSGAPGRTTVAIAVASELASLGHSVALADVDTHGASIAPALGLLDESPGFAAACRLAGTASLTRSELERVSQRHDARTGAFWVLTGIGRPSRWPELSADRVAGTIAKCREWVDFTVLDTSSSLENDEEISSDLLAPRRNAATVTAIRDADEIIAVGSADPVGLSRFLRSRLDLVEAATTDRVTVVMNRVRASAIGLNPQGQVRQTLSRFGGIESPVLVPHDQAAVDGAVLSGATLADAAPRSPARLAIREMVVSRLT